MIRFGGGKLEQLPRYIFFLLLLFGWGFWFDWVLWACFCCCCCLGFFCFFFWLLFVCLLFKQNHTCVEKYVTVNLLCLFFHMLQLHQSISGFHCIITETDSNTTFPHLYIASVYLFPFNIYSENAQKNSCLPLAIVNISSVCYQCKIESQLQNSLVLL